jgi:large subunit ribosomal protein L32
MPNEPKKRHSRARQGKRRASIHLSIPQSVVCANCGMHNVAHSVCKYCGYYKGAQVKKQKNNTSTSQQAA